MQIIKLNLIKELTNKKFNNEDFDFSSYNIVGLHFTR